MQIVDAGWMPLEEACRTIGMSPRTMEKWVRDKTIKSKLVQREGQKAERLFETSDVQRLATLKAQQRLTVTRQEQRPALVKRPRYSEQRRLLQPEPARTELVISTGAITAIRELMTEWKAPARPQGVSPINNGLKLWLTLQEASDYVGLSASTLKKVVGERRVTAGNWGPRGVLVLRRADLEHFSADDFEV